MAKRSGILIGTAGVYYVAYELASRGFHAAITYGNAPAVDLLVGVIDGAATLSLQVKTAERALRTRGRGQLKSADHYEWYVGVRAALLNRPDLFFAFVDLKKGSDKKPDVYLVPSKVIYDNFKPYIEQRKSNFLRWHPKVAVMEEYRNRWDKLSDFLNAKVQTIQA